MKYLFKIYAPGQTCLSQLTNGMSFTGADTGFLRSKKNSEPSGLNEHEANLDLRSESLEQKKEVY